jgi:hypothetical protein
MNLQAAPLVLSVHVAKPSVEAIGRTANYDIAPKCEVQTFKPFFPFLLLWVLIRVVASIQSYPPQQTTYFV